MNNILNKKIIEIATKSGYNPDFVESYMIKKELTAKGFTFRRSALDNLLKKNSKKISDFIKDTYLPKEQKNKFAQISKILNPKKDAPKYYTENDLAFDLSHWFNSFPNGDVLVSPEYFIGNTNEISVIGSLYGNGQVGLHKGKEITKINTHPKYANCHAIESQIASSRGYMRLFVPSKTISHAANNRFGFAQDRKSKIIWCGYIEPQSNGKFNILDKSYSTGKTYGISVENISLSWSAEIKAEYYPTFYNN
jgi:hypothetical protein